MAVFRTDKSENYTVMSNHHLRETEMSLKAKGLLSFMLSLPEEWDYSLKGLVKCCKENLTAVKSALKELEEFGYLDVEKIYPNKENGGKIEYVYNVHEKPLTENQSTGNQQVENQGIENQPVENLPVENQSVENPIQINTKEINTKEQIYSALEEIGSNNKADTKREANELFETLWAMYPLKRGKGQVSDKRKREIFAIGKDEMTRAISRYEAELSKEDWRKPQNGSTFFNSGYVDYLDANYTAYKPKEEPQVQKYDMSSLKQTAEPLGGGEPVPQWFKDKFMRRE